MFRRIFIIEVSQPMSNDEEWAHKHHYNLVPHVYNNPNSLLNSIEDVKELS
jgi:hypothetical protein